MFSQLVRFLNFHLTLPKKFYACIYAKNHLKTFYRFYFNLRYT